MKIKKNISTNHSSDPSQSSFSLDRLNSSTSNQKKVFRGNRFGLANLTSQLDVTKHDDDTGNNIIGGGKREQIGVGGGERAVGRGGIVGGISGYSGGGAVGSFSGASIGSSSSSSGGGSGHRVPIEGKDRNGENGGKEEKEEEDDGGDQPPLQNLVKSFEELIEGHVKKQSMLLRKKGDCVDGGIGGSGGGSSSGGGGGGSGGNGGGSGGGGAFGKTAGGGVKIARNSSVVRGSESGHSIGCVSMARSGSGFSAEGGVASGGGSVDKRKIFEKENGEVMDEEKTMKEIEETKQYSQFVLFQQHQNQQQNTYQQQQHQQTQQQQQQRPQQQLPQLQQQSNNAQCNKQQNNATCHIIQTATHRRPGRFRVISEPTTRLDHPSINSLPSLTPPTHTSKFDLLFFHLFTLI